jgi:TolA-binding protein
MMRWIVKENLPVHTCRVARWLGFLAALGFFATLHARAASAEARAFEAAVRLYDGAAFDLAETELANFVKDYPSSEKVLLDCGVFV